MLIKIEDFFELSIFPIILFIAASLTLRGLLIKNATERLRTSRIGEILIFSFTTGRVASIILIFTFVNDDFGSNSPDGLVKTPYGDGGWIKNISGSSTNRYTSGIQVPVYVFIFGILGGWLRYLYKSATLWSGRPEYNKSKGGSTRKSIFSWENVPDKDSDREAPWIQ